MRPQRLTWDVTPAPDFAGHLLGEGVPGAQAAAWNPLPPGTCRLGGPWGGTSVLCCPEGDGPPVTGGEWAGPLV